MRLSRLTAFTGSRQPRGLPLLPRVRTWQLFRADIHPAVRVATTAIPMGLAGLYPPGRSLDDGSVLFFGQSDTPVCHVAYLRFYSKVAKIPFNGMNTISLF